MNIYLSMQLMSSKPLCAVNLFTNAQCQILVASGHSQSVTKNCTELKIGIFN